MSVKSTKTAKSETAHAHPLDPLPADEFRRVRAALAKVHGVGASRPLSRSLRSNY